MIAAQQDRYIGQSRYFLAHPFKTCTERSRRVQFLMCDGNVAQITDANIRQPGAVLAKRSQMRGPKANPFGAKRRAFARTGGAIVRNADHREIGVRGRKIRAMQVSPKSMRCS